MEDGILIADRPAAAACDSNCREGEGSPEAQRHAAEIRFCCAQARKLDCIVPRQAGDTLTYERVGRDDGKQPALVAQAVGPAARRAVDLAHPVTL